MSKLVCTLLFLSLCVQQPLLSQEAVYYVAPDGNGDGSAARPWDLQTALSSEISPGAIVWLRAGSYTGRFAGSLQGTPEKPIVVSAYPGESVLLNGSPEAPVLTIAGAWTEYRGLEIAGGSTGIRLAGDHLKVIGCSVRDNGSGVVVEPGAGPVELAGNLVYRNGSPGREPGSGILLPGGSAPHLVAGNVVFGNTGPGMVVPAGTGEIVLEGNAVFRNGDASPNILIERERVTLDSNFTYHPGWLPGLRVTANCSSLALRDNYFAGGASLEMPSCAGASLQDNVFTGLVTGFGESANPRNRSSRSAVARAFLRMRPYDSHRAFLVVDNPAAETAVQTDLSRLLKSGDVFSIRSIDGPAGSGVAGTYGGQPVAVPVDPAERFGVLLVERTEVSALATPPAQDLKLWLKADGNLTLNGSQVSAWQDESGANTHAAQTTAASQPALVSGIVNGKPAVRFDGTNDFMTFTLPVNGLTGMTVFLVSAALADLNGGANGVTHAPLFWNETGSWGTLHLSPFQRMVKYRFGTGQGSNLPVYTRPATLGNGFSVTSARKNGSTETLYVNGSLALTQTGKLTTLKYIRDIGNLGRGYNDSTYFNGYIAEVLVYTRALNDTERQEVEQYLIQKYLSSANQAPIVSAGSDSAVTLPNAAALAGSVSDDGLPGSTLTSTWSMVSGPGAVAFGNPSAPATTASFSAAGTYVLRLTATDGDLTATDDVTILVSAAPPLDTTPPAISDVRVAALSHNSATLLWSTDEPSDTQVEYTPAGGSALSSPLDSAKVTSHTVTLGGLTTGTLYQYCVRSRDAAGNLATSCGHSFTTGAAPAVPPDGLRLWFKADEGATLNGSQVSQWSDLSGTGTHAAQTAAASQPLLVPGAINGLPAVRFDGTNDFMTFTLPVEGLTGTTVFLVSASLADLNGGSSGATHAPLFWNETAAWGTLFLSPFQRVIKYRFGTGQGSNLPVYTRPATLGNGFSLTTARKDGATETLYVNGSVALTQTGKLTTLNYIRNVGNLGRGYNDNTYFNGYIAEVLVYARALSDAERQQTEQYLLRKYLPVANQAPVVNAGADATISLPNPAVLAGSVSDDGLPGNTLTSTWSVVSGPGSVAFANPSAPATTATFGATGTYVLRLSATDGALTASDDVAILVNAPDTTSPVISSVRTASLSHNSATIAWTTDEPADTQVEYTPAGGSALSSPLDSAKVTSHSVTLTGLSNATVYQYCVRSRDASGNLATSCGHSFTTAAPPPIPFDGLRLWLKADDGTTLNGSQVSQWSDLSGNGTHALQAVAASQPLLVPGAVNGLPAVRFDGTNDFLTFTLAADGLTGMTLVLVAADYSNATGSTNGALNAPLFWNETSPWGAMHLSPFQSVVKFRFGTGQSSNLPAYSRPKSMGTNFSVTTALKNSATESLFINGEPVLTQTGKLPSLRYIHSTGNLGRGYNNNTYFNGMIAEVLVYNRALTDTERQQVEQYLLARYPRVNEAPVANAGQDQTIALPASASLNGTATDDGIPGGGLTYTWSTASGPGTVSFSSPNTLATTASFSLAGTYVLRLTVNDGALSHTDDVTVVVTPPDTVAPVLLNISAQGLTSSSATIMWDTSEPANSQVEYGLTTAYGTLSELNPAMTTTGHAITLQNLTPDQEYHFVVRSRDAAGNLAVSEDRTFHTYPISSGVVTGGLVAHYNLTQPPGRTSNVNDLEHPSDFENWVIWRTSSAVVTPNVAIAPDGTMTADRVYLRAPDGLLYHPYLAAAPGQTYTFSVYMRTEGGTYQLKLTRDNTACWCGATTPVLTVTDQWQRFSLTYTVAATERASAVGFGYEEITRWNLPAAGEVLVWGAQVEAASSATPYTAGNNTTPDQQVPDQSGLGNAGWLGTTADAVFDSNDPVRKTSALFFDGAPRWVQAPHSTSLDIRSSGTWVVLVKPDPGWVPWATFLSKANGASTLAQYSVGRYSATNQLDFYNGNDNHPYRGGDIPTGVWSVLTVTLDAGVLKGYIDKTEVFSFTGVPDLRPVSASLRLGAFPNYPHYYRGDMATALIYGRALTPAEITQNCDFLKSTLPH